MSFWCDESRAGWLRAAVAALGALLLASCGGGQQVQQFHPNRMIAFGDETSVIESVANDPDDPSGINGRKYSVNYKVDASTPRDCTTFPIWEQYVASGYGLVFPQCNPNSLSTTSQILATVGAHSADVSTQIDGFLASDSFDGKTLVTILAGKNDILDQYEAIKAGTVTQDAAIATLEAAGRALGDQVIRVAQAGGKVLIATVPDQGLLPYAVTEGIDAQTQLSLLTSRFNAKLRTSVGQLNDGHKIGLVLADELLQAMVKSGSYAAFDVACAVDVPDCNTLTLTTTTTTTMTVLPTSSSVASWIWSDAKHLGVAGQQQLGAAALSRAQNNPF